jgi:hypothetical protein
MLHMLLSAAAQGITALWQPHTVSLSCPQRSPAPGLQGEQQLQQLVLSSNVLPALLPCHVSGLDALTRLDLSRNHLGDLAGLACLPRLAVLLLSRNRLQDSSLHHITVRQGLSQQQGAILVAHDCVLQQHSM